MRGVVIGVAMAVALSGCSFYRGTKRGTMGQCGGGPPVTDLAGAALVGGIAAWASRLPVRSDCAGDDSDCFKSQEDKTAVVSLLAVGAAVLGASSVYGFVRAGKCHRARQDEARYYAQGPKTSTPPLHTDTSLDRAADAPSSPTPVEDPPQEPAPRIDDKPGPTPTDEEPARPPQVMVRKGTCFAVSPTGLVVTNHHVVGGADVVQVQFEGGPWVLVQGYSGSVANDLAILTTSTKPPAYLPLASAKTVRRGLRVFTIGFPVPDQLGSDPKFADGSISALSGLGEASMMQTSIPIQRGNSGGAVVTESGFVVGVITWKVNAGKFIEDSGELPEAISFAVKADYIVPLLGKTPIARRVKNRDEAIARAEKATCRVKARIPAK